MSRVPTRRVLDAFLNLDEFIGFKPVGFAVDPCCCLLGGSLYQAEHLATALIKPILQIPDAVLFLRLYIGLVRVRDGICSQTIDFVMDVHVKGHCLSPSVNVATINTYV